jgi:hypothetical protein
VSAVKESDNSEDSQALCDTSILETCFPLISRSRSGGGPSILLDGSPYLADIADEDEKIVYEVHSRGQRKEKQFDNLPQPWRGVNVFIVDRSSPYTIIARVPDTEFAKVQDSNFSKTI